ncbi:MAG: protein kinase [Alphaproteobacteria bacterium]|nr:protein kinase [Alphaproteobacteria bacterium]MCB9796776.1 protein kinase [Alphaproteobacteria bacterium]
MILGLLGGGVRLGGTIGEGGMGRVLRGHIQSDGTPVAVKVLNEEGLQNRYVQLAFGNEVRAVAALNHPGVVPILDYGELPARPPPGLPAGSPYLVMPFARGGTTGDLRGQLSWARLQGLLLDVLDALAHSHARGVLHRDIKPSNILLREAGAPEAGIWLADFGLAGLDAMFHPGAAPLVGGGTRGYRAPEQADPSLGPQGPWTDLYSLGMVAAVLSEAWDAPIEAPPGFWDWLSWVIAPAPDNRPRFAAQAAQALRALPPLRALPSPTPPWTEEPARSPLQPSMSLSVLTLREPSMVGREQERERLWAGLLHVRARRRPAELRVLGPRGLGRSRLARWIAEQAHQAGLARTAVVGLSPGQAARDPFAEALAHVLGLDDQLPSARRRLLARAFEGRGWSEAELSRLEEQLRPRSAFGLSVRVSPGAHRQGLLRRATLDLARAHPLLIVLDDLHHDTDAAKLARSLLNGAGDEGAALLLVTTATDAEALAPLLRPPLETLSLAPLSIGEHRALVRELLGRRRGLLGEIQERSAGDPGFAVQLVRSLEAQGEGPLPEGLQALFSLRLLRAMAELGAEARRALFVAALLGQRVDITLWQAACRAADLPPDEAALEALARAGLLQRDGASLRFLTPLVRETLRDIAAQEGEERALHAACALAYDPEEAPEPVAWHRLSAGDDAGALAPLTQALDRSILNQQNLDHSARLGLQLAALLERLAPRGREALEAELALIHLAHVNEGQGASPARLRGLLERCRAAGERDLELRVQRLYARRHLARSDAEASYRELSALLSGSEGEHRAELLSALAFAARATGRLEEAQELAEQAVPLFEAQGDELGVLEMLRLQTHYLYQTQPGPLALAKAEALRARAERAGRPLFVGTALNFTGIIHLALGELPEAQAALERACAQLDGIGAANRVVPRVNLGVIRVRLGRYAEARPVLERSYRELGRLQRGMEQGFALAWLCRALAGLGDWGAFQPEWAEADMGVARVFPQQTLVPLQEAADLAQAAPQARAITQALLARAEAAAQEVVSGDLSD